MSRKQKTLQGLNIFGLLFALLMNGLANALLLNGYTTGELSDMYPNLFTPAGITFSIWLVIYIMLILFVVYNSRGLFGKKEAPKSLDLTGLWFFISCLANGSWIAAWHYHIVWLSMLLMLMLLFSLINIYRNLGIGVRPVSQKEKYMVHAAISVYLGWITVATVANATALLVYWGFDGAGLPPNFWTAAVVGVATMIGLNFTNKNGDIFYIAVLVWAFLGIIYKRVNADATQYPLIITACISAILILMAGYLRKRSKKEDLAY